MASDIYSQLFSKKLLFITGKGGVGKSTLVYHLAKHATFEFDKEVTVFSVGQSGFYEAHLANAQDKKRLVEGEEVKLFPGATVQVLQTYSGFLEYVHYKVKIPRLVLKLADHPRVRNAFLAIPGLAQTILLGKIWYEARRRSQESPHALVVVEAPPLGQVEQFFGVLQRVKKLFRLGPFYEDAKKIEAALLDPSFCEVVLVTLLDELPVDEVVEYVTQSHDEHMALRYLICNRVVFPEAHRHKKEAQGLKEHPLGKYLYEHEVEYVKELRKLNLRGAPLKLWAFPDYVDITQGQLIPLS